MKRTVLGVLTGLVLIGALACSGPQQPQGAAKADASQFLVLRGFTLIDGNGGPPAADSALIAENGRITWVGPARELKAPEGAAVQDLQGKYVMPGIINLHSHVAESDYITQDPKKLFTNENVQKNLRLYAQYGVTSVASMGTDQPNVYGIREQQRKGRPQVARIFTAGRGFTGKGGYPGFPGGIPGVPYEVGDAAEAAAGVNELAPNRPDLVKIWVDDHFGMLKKIPLQASKGVIEAAHKNDLKAVAHIFYLSDAEQLVQAGVDGLSHSVRDKAVSSKLIDSMKEHGAWQMSATLAREASMFAFAKPEQFVNDPFFTRAVPDNVLTTLKSPEYHKRLTSDPHFAEYPKYLKTAQDNLKRLADAGVKFGFGTDTGPPFRFAGFGEHWEMELMVEAGLTPAQVITAATRNSAEFLGAKDLGTLEREKWADLVVLDADPLADIRNTRKIHSVYVAGNKVD